MDNTPDVVYLAPAIVFACLRTGWLTIILYPGFGMADGGIFREYPMHRIPYHLRMPNTRLYLLLDQSTHELLRVLPRNFAPGMDVDDLMMTFEYDGNVNLIETIRRELSRQEEDRRNRKERAGEKPEPKKRWWRLW